MQNAIPRYGTRVAPETDRIIAECRTSGQLVQGPHIQQFEQAFARRLGVEEAVATSYGRMAFFHILKALRFPPRSEIIVPALTFWVIPELARVAGLTPVFADVDPHTFSVTASSIERVITEKTCAIVPTHLYGLACDMDPILQVAGRHKLVVIEDCAHAIGATYRGRPVGTLGDAALFSFQTLKPLSTFGGGMAIVRNAAIRARVRASVAAETRPTERALNKRLLRAWFERTVMRPGVFTFSGFPILWLSSFVNAKPDVLLWERIRPLDALPSSYTERYSNVQAAIGLAALSKLDEWTARTRRHASILDAALRDLTRIPKAVSGCEHVYYQYCVYAGNRDAFVRQAIRHKVDVETLHMDVCTRLELFKHYWSPAPGADQASLAVQLPVYESLSDNDVFYVARVTRDIFEKDRTDSLMSARPA